MAMRSPPRSTNSPEATPLVGRERAQAILRERLEATASGQGGFILIGGAAGIGKTTLVRWLAAQARDADVLIGHGYDLTLTPPYGPWIDALASVNQPSQSSNPLAAGPDLTAITSQPVLFEQVRLYLESLTVVRPVVLILEDLHWSDPASLELARFMARVVDRLQLLLVGTYRSDELTREQPLFQMLPLLAREAEAERIDLQTLSDNEVLELVTNRYQLLPREGTRLAAWLQARGQGNPFYLTEILRTLETERVLQRTGDGWQLGVLDRASVPPIVRQIIERRLATLDDDTRSLLEVAAAIGQEVPLDVWQAASGANVEQIALAIERASAARVIAETSTLASAAFTHALIRETLYAGMPLARRRLLHQSVAEILARRADPPLNDIASHFGKANDPRAIDWLVRAGQRALTLYAAHDAIVALDWAHDLAARFDRELPVEAYQSRAAAHAVVGTFEHARRDYELVLERGRSTGNGRVEWQALVDLGLLWAERDYERTEAYCRAALDLARSIGDRSMIAHSLNRVANWYVNLDEPDTALPLHQEALAIFEASGDQAGIADSLDLLGMASYLSCDLAASTRYYERAIPIFRDMDERQRLAACLSALAFNGGEADNTIAAPVYREPAYWIRSGEEGLAIAREIGWPAGEALALFALGVSAAAWGHYGRALRHGQAALDVAERVDHRQWAIAGRFTLGTIWTDLLNPSRARRELEQGLSEARMIGSRFWTNLLLGSLASLQLTEGDLSHAAATLGTVIQSDRPLRSMGQRYCWFVQAELAHALGEPERTLAILDQLRDAISDPLSGRDTPQMSKLRGDALVALGTTDDGERAYRAALDGAKLFGFRPVIWRIDTALGALLRADGRSAEADAAFHHAQATIEELAAEIEDDAIREQFQTRALDRLPAPKTADPRSAAAQLSPRELDVLRLLVDGRTDREIATELFISPRTVMRHVAGILTKLDVPSRTAAAAVAIRQGIV